MPNFYPPYYNANYNGAVGMPQAQNLQYSAQPQYSQYQQPYSTMPNYQYQSGYANAVNNKNKYSK